MVALSNTGESPAQLMRLQPKEVRADFLASLDPAEALALNHTWRGWWARPEQLAPPGDWFIWFLRAGRGFGKTRTGAEWVREEVGAGRRARLHFISQDPAAARDIMIEGESGLMACYAKGDPMRPLYEPSKKRITWPNGAVASIFSAEDPEALRGPQCDGAWADEAAAWRYQGETWEQLELGARLQPPGGGRVQIVLTTTPKPTRLIREIAARDDVHTTHGTTYANLHNLDPAFRRAVLARYEGTRLGRQELHAEIIEQSEGALWTRETLEAGRVTSPDQVPQLRRVVVGVDPQAKAGARRQQWESETGIVIAGVDAGGHLYVLGDYSVGASPDAWARRAIAAYHDHDGDKVVAEINQGGDMVVSVLNTADPKVPVKQVRATRGKITRAEPIAALYEQGRVSHVGFLAKLEDQLCNYTGANNEPSPDRMDALVWALTELALGPTVGDIDIDPSLGMAQNPYADI